MTHKERDAIWQQFLKETNDPAVDKYEAWLEARIAGLEEVNSQLSNALYVKDKTLQAKIAELEKEKAKKKVGYVHPRDIEPEVKESMAWGSEYIRVEYD